VKFDDQQTFKQLSALATLDRAQKALTIIQSDLMALVAEATPVGVFGALQGGWHEGPTVVSPTEVATQVINAQPYAYYVVHGSGPARGNPGGFLVKWVDKKLSIPQQYRLARLAGMTETAARNALQRSSLKFQASSLTVAVAFIIGRARMRRGHKGKDFITPILEANQDFWTQILTDAITGTGRPS
jgi:hypothetical protein